MKQEGSSSKKPTYKESQVKGLDPLDTEYIDAKIKEKYDNIFPQWKKEIKEEIMKEIKMEMQEQFAINKKEYEDQSIINKFLNSEDEDDGMEISLNGEPVDIRGHAQVPE